jgi:hypothetical protein
MIIRAMMEALRTSETSVCFSETARLKIAEGCHLQYNTVRGSYVAVYWTRLHGVMGSNLIKFRVFRAASMLLF